MLYGMPEVGEMLPIGVLLMLVYAVVGVGGFLLIPWGLLRITERLTAHRDEALDDLRRRHAGGEIDDREFEVRHRQLAAR